MLSARFEGRKPLVEARVLVGRGAGIAPAVRPLEMGLDFTCPQTTVTTADLGVPDIPLDDIPRASGLEIGALVAFPDSETGPVTYAIPILLRNGPPGTSVVGLDLLETWLVAIDISDGLLVISAGASDARLNPSG